jgi:hypothetical protein
MIIRELQDHYILIKQHDHGILSGEIAFHWGNDRFTPATYQQIIASTFHDFAWVEKDASPIWNEENNIPYDFVNYPTEKKLAIYKEGITNIEKLYPYCALLTSLHYCSFFNGRNDTEIQHFIVDEKKRQQKLMSICTSPTLTDDLNFLKFCDDLSLYVCLNEPGVGKDNEHAWYRDGISYKQADDVITFQVNWINKNKITVYPFPFKDEWQTSISFLKLHKRTNEIVSKGTFTVSFVKNEKE